MLDLARKTYELLGGGAGAASILVAIIALAGAVAGAIVTYLTSGRTVYINAITVERSKWIEKLRANIAAYCAVLANIEMTRAVLNNKQAFGSSMTFDDFTARLAELNEKAAVIKLQLNPFGEIDKNIMALTDGFLIGKEANDFVARLEVAVASHAQWLLKIEWEKVKYEARSWWYRATHFWWEWHRLRQYRAWVKGDGCITKLVEELRATHELH